MYLPLAPEAWLTVHVASIALALVSRVGLNPLVRLSILAVLLAGVVMICLFAAAAFWTQQGCAALSCLTLGTVLIALVFDRPHNTSQRHLALQIAVADEVC